MNLKTLTDLYKHMEWSDAMVWRAALDSESGRKDKKLRDYFYHLHMVQRAFLRAWRGEPRETPYPTFDDAQSLMLWGRSYYPEAFAQIEKLSDDDMARPMPVPWASMVEARLGPRAGHYDDRRDGVTSCASQSLSSRPNQCALAGGWWRAAAGRLHRVGVDGKTGCGLGFNPAIVDSTSLYGGQYETRRSIHSASDC